MIFIVCNKVYLIWDFSISLGSLLDFLTHHISIKHHMAVCLVSFYYNLSFFFVLGISTYLTISHSDY